MSVLLRRCKLQDAENMSRLLSEKSLHQYLSDDLPCPYPLDRAKAYLLMAKEVFPLYCAVEWLGEMVGLVTLRQKAGIFCPNVELGYWIGKPYQGRGIGTEAVRQISRVAFRQPGVERISALVFAENIASLRLLSNVGYYEEALLSNSLQKDGALHDCLLYTALRMPWEEQDRYTRAFPLNLDKD